MTTEQVVTVEETGLIENKELREELIGRVETLDKVKELLLIQGTEWMTRAQVAEYYEVEENTIRVMVQRNREELGEDGVKLIKRAEMENILKAQDVSLEKGSYTTTFSAPTGLVITISNRGALVFPKRAILRAGMLLRDSKVAKEVRTQLLNIEEGSTPEAKTVSIDEEQQLTMALAANIATGDMEGFMLATTELMAFKNRHIEKIETKNQYLEKEYNKIEPKQAIRKAVNSIASATRDAHGNVWNKLYAELYYKHGINIKSRKGTGSKISKLTEDEQKSMLAIAYLECEKYGIDLEEQLAYLTR